MCWLTDSSFTTNAIVVQCWASVEDCEPMFNPHRVNVSWLLFLLNNRQVGGVMLNHADLKLNIIG